MNAFASGVVACLLAVSVVLSLTAIFPALDGRAIAWTLGVGLALALAVAAIVARTPALDTLPPIALSRVDRGRLAAMRGYLVAAIALVVVRAILTAAGRP